MNCIIRKRGSIYLNEGAWDVLNERLHKLKPSTLFILTDTNTEHLCLPLLLDGLSDSFTPQILVMAHGETNKNINTCLRLWEELSTMGADRKSLIINLGGGVVTDIGGFIASTFKRGIEFINVPTSLLAMVDASVGGKNGIDLGILKNQIGIIKDPDLVIVDTRFLKTLPKEEINSGRAEMLKHGLIHSEAYWEKVRKFDEYSNKESEELIWESIQIKNAVVTQDPFEKSLRKTLNYGHTLGHAIESHFLNKPEVTPLLHGEAIAIGMILSSYISHKLLEFPEHILDEITNTIFEYFSKISFNREDIDKIIDLLIYDKKNTKGKVLFVLLKNIGEHRINCEVSNELIYEAFEYYESFN